jgi:hypothetical protein
MCGWTSSPTAGWPGCDCTAGRTRAARRRCKPASNPCPEPRREPEARSDPELKEVFGKGSERHGHTDAIEALEAAQAAAGDKIIAVSTPTLTQQYLDAGRLDEIVVSLIPVLLGVGIPFFAHLAKTPIRLDDPVCQNEGVGVITWSPLRSTVVQGKGVTHLTYGVPQVIPGRRPGR